MHPPRLRWEATPPPGAYPPPEPRRPARYLGPPAYRTPPRWGFPALAWRWPTSVPGVGPAGGDPAPSDRVRTRGRLAVSALWTLAVVATLAAGAEVWRYALLVRSRTSALPRDVVTLSDTLVVTGSVLSLAAGAIAVTAAVLWLFPARVVAAAQAGYLPARPDWVLLPALLVPGVNLVLAGAIAAELEHAALRRPVDARPTPGGLLRAWWITAAAGGLLFAATVLWRFRDGVQAQADGVLLTAATDLAAAAVAVLTALVIARLSALLAPIDPTAVRFLRVVRVAGAPEPPLRAHRPADARR